MEEEEEALGYLPGEHALVAMLRRHADTGELPAWVHQMSAYDASPVLLTSGLKKVTAADGSTAWFFLYTPPRKDGSSSRCSRTAGGATWIEERTRPVEKASSDGGWVVIGHASTFTYGKRTTGPDKRRKTERLGWILVEVRLPGEDLCCAKMYPSPRKTAVAPPPPPAAPEAAVAPPPPPAAPEAAVAHDPPPASPSAAAVPPPSAPAAVAAPPAPAPAPALVAPPAATVRSPTPVAPPAAAAVCSPTPVAPPAAPAARSPTPVAPPAPAARSPTPVAPPAPAADSSPDKTWVNVLVSKFPTKLSNKGMSKRVHKLLLPTEGGLDSPPAKRRLLACTGWLSINTLEGSA